MYQNFKMSEAVVTSTRTQKKAGQEPLRGWWKSERWVNHSDLEVRVSTEQGEGMLVPPTEHLHKRVDKKLYRVVEYTVHPEYAIEHGLPFSLDGYNIEEVECKQVINGMRTFIFEHEIDIDGLELEYSKPILVADLGVIINPARDAMVRRPDGSIDAIERGVDKMSSRLGDLNGNGLGFKYVVVCNENPGKLFYTVVNNKLYKLVSVASPSVPDGLWCFYTHLPEDIKPTTTQISVFGKSALHYPFSESVFDPRTSKAEEMEVMIFTDKHTAEQYGGWASVRRQIEDEFKRKENELKHNTEMTKLQRENIAANTEVKTTALAEEKADRDAQRDVEKYKRDIDKLTKESDAQNKKAFAEGIKTTGAIVGAVMSLVAVGVTIFRKAAQSALLGPLGWLF